MAKTRTLAPPPSLHARLFDYVRKEGYAFSDDPQKVEHYARPSFSKARDLLSENTKLEKDADTGLWQHVLKDPGDLFEYRPEHTRGYYQLLWPAGRFMAQYLAGDPGRDLIDGKAILSIGPGSGLTELYLLKKRQPRMIACVDKDIFALAVVEMNAAANDIEIGDRLVTLQHADALNPVSDGGCHYRLYDTVLAADCFYAQSGVRAAETRQLAEALKNLNAQGADIVIADRDEVKLRKYEDNFYLEEAKSENGMVPDKVIAQADMQIDTAALLRVSLKNHRKQEPVLMYHWPASAAKRPLPRVNIDWWRPAPG